MQAKLKKLIITPTKFDKDGEATTPETASITFDVELIASKEKAAVVKLLDLLSQEWMEVEMTNTQLPLDLKETKESKLTSEVMSGEFMPVPLPAGQMSELNRRSSS